jgi:pyruvate kinase
MTASSSWPSNRSVEAIGLPRGRRRTVTSHKGINLPGTRVSAPTLTDKDREDIRFGVEQGVDYVALSFVRGADDVRAAKTLIADAAAASRHRKSGTAGGHHLS